jgi:hypothetical protein
MAAEPICTEQGILGGSEQPERVLLLTDGSKRRFPSLGVLVRLFISAGAAVRYSLMRRTEYANSAVIDSGCHRSRDIGAGRREIAQPESGTREAGGVRLLRAELVLVAGVLRDKWVGGSGAVR